jgi:hypothetical protein
VAYELIVITYNVKLKEKKNKFTTPTLILPPQGGGNEKR